MRRPGVWIFCGFLCLLGAGLRLWGLKAESVTYDEVAASLAALHPVRSYLSANQYQLDRCPPIYYLLLHPVALLNPSLNMLRFLSVLGGVAAIAAAYLLGRLALSPRAAALGAFLLTINPLHIALSQQATSLSLFTVLIFAAFFFLVKTSQGHKTRDWLIYDGLLVAGFYLYREALMVTLACFLIHVLIALFYKNQKEQRRITRLRALAIILYNYLIILAVALPWLFIIPGRNPWLEVRPPLSELLALFWRNLHFGVIASPWLLGLILLGMIALLLLPPLVRLLRSLEPQSFAVFAGLLLIPLLPFGLGYIGRARFSAPRQAMLALPFYCYALGLVLARCNFYVRTPLLLGFIALAAGSIVPQALSRQFAPQWDVMAGVVRDHAKPHDTVVYWPDFTSDVGDYFFGNQYQVISATDLFEKLPQPPPDQNFYFVISQYPTKGAHLHTFPGALKQFAKSTPLWNSKLNRIIAAHGLDAFQLKLWYEDPEKLNVVDQPTSQTAFIFTPQSEVFRGGQFHAEEVDLSYDLDGRRYVWTATDHTDLSLKVNLAPASYLLRLHCSPKFDQPEFDRHIDRSVRVTLRTGEEKRELVITGETTLNLTFTADTELTKLPVHIEVSPMLKLKSPRRESYGIKIYSISVDQVVEQPPL